MANNESARTKLIIDKDAFRAQLADQKKIGQELYGRQIKSALELDKAKREYASWNDFNSELLKSAFNTPASEYKTSYDWCANTAVYKRLVSTQDQIDDHKKNLSVKVDNLTNLFNKVNLIQSEIKQTSSTQADEERAFNTNIFIVHGQNEVVKLSVSATLKSLGLKPIILHDQPNHGKTIIEKFEKYSDVGYAVVLLTDDDEGKAKKDKDFKSRARQNVVLELGFFIGKLGRSKVCTLYTPNVEIPSDLSGIVYTLLDDAGMWKYTLAGELKAAGYDIDKNHI